MKNIVKIDSDFSLIEPNVHDAFLSGIDFGGKQVVLSFRQCDGARIRLILDNVVQMMGTNLAEANIVLDVAILDGDDVPVDLLNFMFPERTEAQARYRADVVSKLKANSLKLFHLSPSYGGEITIVCESVSYEAFGDLEETSAALIRMGARPLA